jgi:hypothetical protein
MSLISGIKNLGSDRYEKRNAFLSTLLKCPYIQGSKLDRVNVQLFLGRNREC